MNRIALCFSELTNRRLRAFIAYITAGDPSLEPTEQIILELERCGADIVELGVPFSDPMGDGPVIQRFGPELGFFSIVAHVQMPASLALRLITRTSVRTRTCSAPHAVATDPN